MTTFPTQYTIKYWYEPGLVSGQTIEKHSESLIAIPSCPDDLYRHIVDVSMPHEKQIYDTLRKWHGNTTIEIESKGIPYTRRVIFERVEKPENADLIVYPKKYENSFSATGTGSTNPFIIWDDKIILQYLEDYPKASIIVFCNDDESDQHFDKLVGTLERNWSNAYPNRLFFFHTSRITTSTMIRPSIGTGFHHQKFQTPTTLPLLEQYSMPCFTALETIKQFTPLPFEPKPKIGFCGALTSNLRRSFIKGLQEYKYRNANKFNEIFDINIIERQNFWDGMAHLNTLYRTQSATNPQKQSVLASITKSRAEFESNLSESIFGLAIRGAGNFSYRFWEILKCGRIPIIIEDTGYSKAYLPFEKECPDFYAGVIRIDGSKLFEHFTDSVHAWMETQFFPVLVDWYIKNLRNIEKIQKHNHTVSQLFDPMPYLENVLWFVASKQFPSEKLPELLHTVKFE